jgi:hypothetical protein
MANPNPLQHWDESLEKSDEILTLISLTREGGRDEKYEGVGWGGEVILKQFCGE